MILSHSIPLDIGKVVCSDLSEKYLVYITDKNIAAFFDREKGFWLKIFKCFEFKKQITNVYLFHDNLKILCISNDQILGYQIKDKKVFFNLFSKSIYDVKISFDNSYIAVSYANDTIGIFHCKNKKLPNYLNAVEYFSENVHTQIANALNINLKTPKISISYSSKFLAAVYANGLGVIWDIERKVIINYFFSPIGKFIDCQCINDQRGDSVVFLSDSGCIVACSQMAYIFEQFVIDNIVTENLTNENWEILSNSYAFSENGLIILHLEQISELQLEDEPPRTIRNYMLICYDLCNKKQMNFLGSTDEINNFYFSKNGTEIFMNHSVLGNFIYTSYFDLRQNLSELFTVINTLNDLNDDITIQKNAKETLKYILEIWHEKINDNADIHKYFSWKVKIINSNDLFQKVSVFWNSNSQKSQKRIEWLEIYVKNNDETEKWQKELEEGLFE